MPAGNFIHAVLAPWIYDGESLGLATAIPLLPPTSVTCFPSPDKSVHEPLLHESAV
jgi:hypothetical protein